MNKERLKRIISQFNNKRIAVVGDLILDTYIWGKAERISQEAPVPVLQVGKKTHSLGGASNVMRNISSLGAKCFAFGVVGNDANGTELLSLLEKNNVITDFVQSSNERQTIEKQRILAGNQQLLRIDYEKIDEISDDIRKRIILGIEEIAEGLDCIIIEDYAKGLLNDDIMRKIVRIAQRHQIPIGLDPHPTKRYEIKGLTFSTPNRNEAYAIAGVSKDEMLNPEQKLKSLQTVAQKLIKKWQTENLLITLGADGMALFNRNCDCKLIPTQAKEVYDVTGAGDTVIAVFALALVSNANTFEAAQMANHAAGIVVGRIGTSTVSSQELLQMC